MRDVRFEMNESEIASLVEQQVCSIADAALQESTRQFLVPVQPQHRTYGWDGEIEEYRLWVVADMQTREVGIGFAEGGFAKQGLPWGLVFLNQEDSGGSGNWYATLEDCIIDSGYIETDTEGT